MTTTTTTATAPVRPVTHESATATLVLAFAADPIIRWVLPAPSAHLTYFPEVVRVLGAAAFAAETAETIADTAGAAVWVPPGSVIDEQELGRLVSASVEPDRHPTMFAFLEQMDEHHPDEPLWYLPFIGVEPGRQGQGLGGELLRHGLARADADGLPAYLEASSPRNRALYERHGFQVTGEIQVADSPPMWPMLRPAQR